MLVMTLSLLLGVRWPLIKLSLGVLMVVVLYIVVIGCLRHLVPVLLFLRDFVQGKLLLLMVVYCCLCVCIFPMIMARR